MDAQAGYTVGTEHPATLDPADRLADAVRAELEQARKSDEAAREHRRRAGRKLAQLRTLRGSDWLAGLELNESSAVLLVELAVGSRPHHF